MKDTELSILNINISYFENCQSTVPVKIPLLNWLTNIQYREKVEQLRALQDESLQKIIKTSLPAITPSGLFSYRDTKHLIEHSGFLAFDIDKKDNKHISFEGIKGQISHIQSVAYCGLSVRGQGYWGLVPIPKSTPDEHKQRFNALIKDFKAFDINLDPSGSDICRLRIYSWDADGYFNHNAKLYTKLFRSEQKTYSRPVFTDTRDRVEAIIAQINEHRIDITEDYKEEWLKIASALATEFGESGRGYFHNISKFHSKYASADTDRMFDGCLKHNYNKVSIGSFFQIAFDHGIKLISKSEVAKPVTTKPLVINPTEGKQSLVVNEASPWDHYIAELESFFSSVTVPLLPLKLNQCTKIVDFSKCVESHFATVKAHNGNKGYLPYLERLREIRDYLTNNMN